jgi:hypothetical protein
MIILNIQILTMEDCLYIIIIIFGVLLILCIGCHCFRLHEQQKQRKQITRIVKYRRRKNSIEIEFDNNFEEIKEEPKLDIIISN